MATFQRASKLAAAPLGAAVATAFTSSFFSNKTTQYTTSQFTRIASNNVRKSFQNFSSVNYQGATRSTLYNNAMSTKSGSAGLAPTRRIFSSQAVVPPSNGGFLQWYEKHLEARPVFTKMVTGSFLWGLGDAVAQIIPPMFFPPESVSTTKETKVVEYDYPRTARAVFYGFAIHAPLSHAHYNFLEWMTVKGGFTGLGIPVFKAFMEQFVYWSWFSNALYHGAMGGMQGMSVQQIYDRLADVLWETQKAQWVFWIPVQLLNFRFVPVRHQLNVVLLTSVVWTALLSMWYPPEDDTKKIENEDNK
jgi:protein Mpv17